MERLACANCKGIICADSADGEKVMGQRGTDRFITFPENVADCPRRVVVPETEWYIPDGRPDLMMPMPKPKV